MKTIHLDLIGIEVSLYLYGLYIIPEEERLGRKKGGAGGGELRHCFLGESL